MGSAVAKRKRVQIKNFLPKEDDMPKASGEIVLRKHKDFNILCFDINIDSFYLVHVRLRPQNHPIPPPMPDMLISIQRLNIFTCV